MRLSYKFKLRAKSFLHPIRSLKALYFIHCIQPTDKWRKIVETDRKKAMDMKWNRFYREKFPWKNPRTLNEKLTWLEAMTAMEYGSMLKISTLMVFPTNL